MKYCICQNVNDFANGRDALGPRGPLLLIVTSEEMGLHSTYTGSPHGTTHSRGTFEIRLQDGEIFVDAIREGETNRSAPDSEFIRSKIMGTHRNDALIWTCHKAGISYRALNEGYIYLIEKLSDGESWSCR